VLDAVIDLVGDVNLRRYQESDESCLDEVAGELSLADLRVGNLEGAFASRQEELSYKPGWHDGQPEMAKCLVGRFDVVGCANNVHYGAAIGESVDVLDDLGILHTGAGRDSASARQPATREVGAGRVGMLAYTSVFEPTGHAATASSAGVATIKASTAYEPSPRVLQMPGAPAIVHTWADRAELDRAVQDVRALKETVDFVVVYLHFGVSMSQVVHDYQREIAHALIDAGADVIAGSHSHTLGGVEFYGSGLVFYSLGNFIFNVGFHPQATLDGALAKVVVRGNRIASCTMLPTYRNADARTTFPDISRGEGARIAQMITQRSAEFGTKVQVVDQALHLTR
jgi:poly-gamma-glutamate capsule biosynthesis protein CapA/YwtB (metallophosphatase superfamily)